MTEQECKVCERFKEIRNSLGMKQGVFAKEIKTTQGHVSDIENKRKGVSDRVVEIICLKFDVNEEWLRTGNGEMFIPKTKNEQINEMLVDVLKCEDSDFKKRLVVALSKMDDTGWNALEKFIDSIANQSQEE